MAKFRSYSMSLAHLIEQNAKMWSNAGRMNLKKNSRNGLGYDDFLVLDVICSYKKADTEFIANVLCKQKSYIDKISADLKGKKLITEDNKKFKITNEGSRVYEDVIITHNKLITSIEKFFTENDLKTLYKLQHKLQNVMLSLCNADYI